MANTEFKSLLNLGDDVDKIGPILREEVKQASDFDRIGRRLLTVSRILKDTDLEQALRSAGWEEALLDEVTPYSKKELRELPLIDGRRAAQETKRAKRQKAVKRQSVQP